MITVKTYPNPSETYGETVCVAGVRLDRGRPQSNCEQMHFSPALRAHKSPFAISYGQLAHRHQIGTPGRIPHGIATELFRNGERRHRERSGRGGMGLEGSRGGA
jgi:hypothetical protein